MSAMTAQRFEEVYFDGVDDMLAHARTHLDRISPRAAFQEALTQRSVIVDIRSERQRAAEGEIHPLLAPVIIDRNELEWSLDPGSTSRLPIAGYDTRVIVVCRDGRTSSLAAGSLRQLGVAKATDIVGGFTAWRETGMPVSFGTGES